MARSTNQSTATSMQTCPMGAVCKGMMEKPLSGRWLMAPGVAFIVLGVLIVIEPWVLPWVIATSCVLAGIMILMMVTLMRRMFHAIPRHE